jgi:ribulose-bisphosphate carboxylase large chain
VFEFAREHHEFARAFDSFTSDADQLYPEWRQELAKTA